MTASDSAQDLGRHSSATETVARLRNQLRLWERSCRAGLSTGFPDADPSTTSTGSPELDQLLPERGFPPGSVVEWIAEHSGGGAISLAWLTLKQAAQRPGWIVVVDPQSEFYPPAMGNLGVDLERVLVVRPRNEADALWAFDQALRSPGVVAAWMRRDRLREHDFRRLQLAAEAGQTLGLLTRPKQARSQPSWAYARLAVRAMPSIRHRGLEVEILRAAGTTPGARLGLELEEGTGRATRLHQGTTREPHPVSHSMSSVSPVAAATSGRRVARA